MIEELAKELDAADSAGNGSMETAVLTKSNDWVSFNIYLDQNNPSNQFSTVFFFTSLPQSQHKVLKTFFGNSIERLEPVPTSNYNSVKEFMNDGDNSFDLFTKFPKLAGLFIKYNTGIPSSGPCESLFSVARYCLQYNRLSISNTSFEAQLLLKVNKFTKKNE